jgi:hypothetical protein
MKQISVVLLSFIAAAFLSVTVSGDAYGKACNGIKDLASCPMSGCEPATSPHGIGNTAKRTIPPAGTPVKLTFDDFAALQDLADEVVDQNTDLTKAERGKLRELNLKSPNRTVSEGDLVELTGFLIGLPHRPGASGAESVNCRLTGVRNSDFHIPMARHASDSEFEGIVVEMIPQGRNEAWTTKKLKNIAAEKRPVMVRGQLFYDNKHLVNDDPDEPKDGQPKRFSLWEIHPVTEFLVCMTASKKCTKQSQFEALEDIPDPD